MKRLPSFSALRALEAASRERSYSAAARELGVTQGAISMRIRKLEAELGVLLFRRSGNSMMPTAEALALAQHFDEATARLDAAVSSLADRAAREPVVISVDARFASKWLAPKLPRLSASPLRHSLEIRVEERFADLTSDGVDAALRGGRGDWPGLQAERLTTERLWIVCSPDFAVRHEIREPHDLLRAPLIHSTDHQWALLFDTLGLPTPRPEGFVSNHSLVMLEAVEKGMGAALLLSSLVEEDLLAGRLVRPIVESIALPPSFIRPGRWVRNARTASVAAAEMGYFLVWRADNPKQRRILALRDWLRAEAQEVRRRVDEVLPVEAELSG